MRKIIAKDLGYENKFDWKKEKNYRKYKFNNHKIYEGK